ncbi:MAG: hypothetical protein GY757_11405 [bacterium]|nr:hypothetical protein [bacterium]
MPAPLYLDNNGEVVISTRITHYKEENSGIDSSNYIGSVEISSDYANIKKESLTRIFKGQKRETLGGDIKILCPSVFSNPFLLNEHHRYAPFYHKSAQSKALPEIFRR